jgi:hypothetical protein
MQILEEGEKCLPPGRAASLQRIWGTAHGVALPNSIPSQIKDCAILNTSCD